jgi:hypothetical protein
VYHNSTFIKNEHHNYKVCPESKVPFFRSKYLFKNNKSNTYSSEKICIQTLCFHKVTVHFYSLAPKKNKCVYALSVSFLVQLLFVSGSKLWTFSSVVTIRDKKKASPSASKRDNSEEITFLRICVRLWDSWGAHLEHHPLSRIFQGVCEMGKTFYPGLLQQIKPGSIVVNRRQKGAEQEVVPTVQTHTCSTAE